MDGESGIIIDHWPALARRALLGLRTPEGAWGYQRGGPPCPEPTALAALALLAEGTATTEARQAAAWLASVQRADGALGAAPQAASPGWGTPYALWLWNAAGEHAAARRRAAAWLLTQKGETDPNDPRGVIGHDTTLVGWPWVDRTHSWIEPTALAVLALRREGFGDHPRVREGLRLIADRAIVSGGWNAGNKEVYGRPLRAQPGVTGLTLVALAPEAPRPACVARAVQYLGSTLPDVRAAESLGWGLIGLRAWAERPDGAERWLRESFDRVVHRADAAPRLALLLLAAAERGVELCHG